MLPHGRAVISPPMVEAGKLEILDEAQLADVHKLKDHDSRLSLS